MDIFIEYAPVIIVVMVFLLQQKLIITPEQLEKKHREIIFDIEKRFKELPKLYVTLPAYLSFREQALDDLREVKEGIDYIKKLLINKENDF